MRKTKIEIKIIYSAVALLFTIFLVIPLVFLLIESFYTGQRMGLEHYREILTNKAIFVALKNSLIISTVTAVITTCLGFALAYAIHFTNIFKPLKKVIETGIIFPMLLPTITYGFAIIYAFGKQGLITKILGKELFVIYGFNGLLIGYVIYTLPSVFLLINNSFSYIDKKYIIVSKLLHDGIGRRFFNTILRPMLGTIGGAFVLSFILSFTDFGIPASVGGTYEVIATQLYQQMLGAIPNFGNGAIIALLMLIPAVFSVLILNYLERFNFHYDKISEIEIERHRGRDFIFGAIGIGTVVTVIAIFAVMFITPFVQNWPYDLTFTLDFVKKTLSANNLLKVYQNSLFVAGLTAVFGTLLAYSAALMNTRSNLTRWQKLSVDTLSMITNSVPGMVLGLAYLLFFTTSNLKGTFFILIVCNMIHFFTTPYLMAKNSLSKINPAWETTGELMGDTWIQTILRVVVPNSFGTLIEMLTYYFVNSMVTISAIIFLVGSRTNVLTSKIKELQHYAKFNEIFVLSLLILLTNLLVKGLSKFMQYKFKH